MSEEKKNIPIEDAKEELKQEAEATEEAAEEAAEGAPEEEKTSEESEATDEASKEPEQSAEEIESERYMRLMAEFQNFRKRAAKEKSDIHAFANERIVNDLMPVLDNFERALAGAEGTESGEAAGAAEHAAGEMSEELKNYAKGMELIFEQLKTALEKAGLKEIEALGKDFDPALHNAVMTESTDEFEDGKISKVLQKGYTLNDRVIRPSMVAVNKK
jgi:molecular chaperone GrpE